MEAMGSHVKQREPTGSNGFVNFRAGEHHWDRLRKQWEATGSYGKPRDHGKQREATGSNGKQQLLGHPTYNREHGKKREATGSNNVLSGAHISKHGKQREATASNGKQRVATTSGAAHVSTNRTEQQTTEHQ